MTLDSKLENANVKAGLQKFDINEEGYFSIDISRLTSTSHLFNINSGYILHKEKRKGRSWFRTKDLLEYLSSATDTSGKKLKTLEILYDISVNKESKESVKRYIKLRKFYSKNPKNIKNKQTSSELEKITNSVNKDGTKRKTIEYKPGKIIAGHFDIKDKSFIPDAISAETLHDYVDVFYDISNSEYRDLISNLDIILISRVRSVFHYKKQVDKMLKAYKKTKF